MGTNIHHALLVHANEPHEALMARLQAMHTFYPEQVSSLCISAINGYASFMVGPDGARDGADRIGEGDKEREAFTAWLDKRNIEWLEVSYGEKTPEVTRAWNVEQMILDACQGLGWQFVPSCEPTALAAGVSGPTLRDGGDIQPTAPDASEFGSQVRGVE